MDSWYSHTDSYGHKDLYRKIDSLCFNQGFLFISICFYFVQHCPSTASALPHYRLSIKGLDKDVLWDLQTPPDHFTSLHFFLSTHHHHHYSLQSHSTILFSFYSLISLFSLYLYLSFLLYAQLICWLSFFFFTDVDPTTSTSTLAPHEILESVVFVGSAWDIAEYFVCQVWGTTAM